MKAYDYTRNCEKFGYLLTWEDAERKAGRRLDYYNNHDNGIYFSLLITEIIKAGLTPVEVED
jgi:hypothetical protein